MRVVRWAQLLGRLGAHNPRIRRLMDRSQTTTVFSCYESACAVITFINRVHVRYDCHFFIFGYTYVCEYVRLFIGLLTALSVHV